MHGLGNRLSAEDFRIGNCFLCVLVRERRFCTTCLRGRVVEFKQNNTTIKQMSCLGLKKKVQIWLCQQFPVQHCPRVWKPGSQKFVNFTSLIFYSLVAYPGPSDTFFFLINSSFVRVSKPPAPPQPPPRHSSNSPREADPHSPGESLTCGGISPSLFRNGYVTHVQLI